MIPPTDISNNGVYDNGKITWSEIPAGTDGVTFDVNQTITVDSMEVTYSGSVVQYVE
ncbi:Ig-like domain-containing protein [Rahnella inusitata]|uniref:Ig-like domain-containing protein n=1 Tax=Rahnella inusitata TaxID=58169 RepID=UPI0039B02718